MRRLSLLFAFSFCSSAIHAVDYSDARVTGIGLVAGEDQVRFTIDKDQNVVFTTTQYSGEQLKRLVALIIAAYTTQSPVFFIRSSESSSSTARHYTDVTIFDVGSYTFN